MRPTHCSKCGTALMEANILYEIIVQEELFQIEDVPALVCRDCGEEWVEAEVRENIEAIIKDSAGPRPN
jgi:uncharacterized Zn ribbon protein